MTLAWPAGRSRRLSVSNAGPTGEASGRLARADCPMQAWNMKQAPLGRGLESSSKRARVEVAGRRRREGKATHKAAATTPSRWLLLKNASQASVWPGERARKARDKRGRDNEKAASRCRVGVDGVDQWHANERELGSVRRGIRRGCMYKREERTRMRERGGATR